MPGVRTGNAILRKIDKPVNYKQMGNERVSRLKFLLEELVRIY